MLVHMQTRSINTIVYANLRKLRDSDVGKVLEIISQNMISIGTLEVSFGTLQ